MNPALINLELFTMTLQMKIEELLVKDAEAYANEFENIQRACDNARMTMSRLLDEANALKTKLPEAEDSQ